MIYSTPAVRLLTLGLLVSVLYFKLNAQDKPVINLIQPFRELTKISQNHQYIIGSVCTGCTLTANDNPVYVYPTGAFVYELNVADGAETTVQLKAQLRNKKVQRTIRFQHTIPPKPTAVSDFRIESFSTWPEGNLALLPGDRIRFKVKALPGQQVFAMGTTPLFERPPSGNDTLKGIYQGSFVIDASDTFDQTKIFVRLQDSTGRFTDSYSGTTLSRFREQTGITLGRLAHLEYGLGDDRLGGAKMGYIDSNVVLQLTGKIGSDYRVALCSNRTAYIPAEHVQLAASGTPRPESFTGKISVWGDEKADYVKIQLQQRLPFQSRQLTDPSRIEVDLFGATSNTNWITQFQSAREIRKTEYEQIADGLFRISLTLQHQQHWGHRLYYQGNALIVQIKRQPDTLDLQHFTIAIDAGHGGTNNGAPGATGVYEKELALLLSLELRDSLLQRGARVIMTREEETFFDNKERILFYRDSTPDLLLSLHLNSSDDPLHVGGTSAYYRYIGFKPLSNAIYQRMLELGLKEYGITGSFNFMLNSPTEYPNCLIETLFISNPEEEMRMLDPEFRSKMTNKIILGLNDFLLQCQTPLH